jgi:hypothetical protein
VPASLLVRADVVINSASLCRNAECPLLAQSGRCCRPNDVRFWGFRAGLLILQ